MWASRESSGGFRNAIAHHCRWIAHQCRSIAHHCRPITHFCNAIAPPILQPTFGSPIASLLTYVYRYSLKAEIGSYR